MTFKRFRVAPFALSTAVIALLAAIAPPAGADVLDARRHFLAASGDEQFETMVGLIATGDFNGFSFQGFTQRFYRAILDFEKREGLVADGILVPDELERLKERASTFLAFANFMDYKHPTTGTELIVPRRLFDREVPYSKGISFFRNDRQLMLSFAAHPASAARFEALFDILRKPASDRSISYARLKPDFFVVNGINKGRKFYTIMRRTRYGSEGFTLTWGDDFETSASRLSTFMANRLMEGTQETDEPQQDANEATPNTTAEGEPPKNGNGDATEKPPEERFSTGTGFRVADNGLLLTNFHVAGKCKSLTVSHTGIAPVPATLVAGDEQNDLALIKTSQALDGPIATFREGPSAKAGTEIAVYGFPLAGLLSSSGNIVTGNITSLPGMGDNSNLYQISAPVQPGNSGGPVIDKQGHIVAIVVSKLNAKMVASAIDDIPQNVNFAIKGSIAQNFLDGANIKYTTSGTAENLDTPALAELAQTYTFMIGCME